MNYNKLFKAGKKACTEQLEANEHKEGWDDIEISYAANGIEANQSWLYIELESPRDYKEIRRRAANIANHAQMIILKCDKELEK